MKRVITAALALSLLSGTAAVAQSAERQERQDARAERRTERADRQERREDRPAAAPNRTIREQRERVQENREQVRERREGVQERRQTLQEQRQRLQEAQAAGEDVTEQRERLRERRDRVQEQSQRVREQREQVQQQRERLQDRVERRDDRRDWNRNYRPGDGRQLRDRDRGRSWYDASRWRHSYYASQRYRAGAYRYPSGWQLRSWVFGDLMPRGWFTRDYYINSMSYGLPRAPIGTEWVRNHDDALLVDVWTGRVLAVYHNLFW